MTMTRQQKRERAAQVHELGLRASERLGAVIADLDALGESRLVATLRARLFELRKDVARRCNELEHEGLTHAQRDEAATLTAMRRELSGGLRPMVRCLPVSVNAQVTRLLPADQAAARLHADAKRLARRSKAVLRGAQEGLDAG